MAETITMPKLGFDMQEGTLVRWVRNEGEAINKGDILAEIETDKATVEVESSAGGTVRKLLVEQGTVVPIGAAIAIIGTKDEKIDLPAKSEAKPEQRGSQPVPAVRPPAQQPSASGVAPGGASARAPSPVTEPPRPDDVRASPLAKRLARESHVDLTHLQGSGPAGRIVRKDIEAALAQGGAQTQTPQVTSGLPTSTTVNVHHQDEEIRLSKLRQAIARRMSESKTTAPHFYVTHEYKMDALLALRDQANSMLPDDQKISVNDFIIKATALCLRQFPNLNAAYTGDTVLRYGAVNLAVAVAVEGGLLTVVCKDADRKNLQQISQEVRSMAARARSGKVHPEDIEGSTFSVSNLGMFDVENFAAILNPPEAGILAVGSAREVPVVDKGEIKAGWRMKATIAVDHRVSDGAEAAQFMQALAQYIEVPLSLFL